MLLLRAASLQRRSPISRCPGVASLRYRCPFAPRACRARAFARPVRLPLRRRNGLMSTTASATASADSPLCVVRDGGPGAPRLCGSYVVRAAVAASVPLAALAASGGAHGPRRGVWACARCTVMLASCVTLRRCSCCVPASRVHCQATFHFSFAALDCRRRCDLCCGSPLAASIRGC